MADENNEKKPQVRSVPLKRDRYDEAERPGGAYIKGDVVVDAKGEPIPGLIVGPDGTIHQVRG